MNPYRFVRIADKLYKVETGAWRFEKGKMASHGFGCYINLDNSDFNEKNPCDFLNRRCGISALKEFGYDFEIVEIDMNVCSTSVKQKFEEKMKKLVDSYRE